MTSIGGNYTQLHIHGDQAPIVRGSLKKWEHRLPGGMFFRIHRSTIVNLARIDKLTTAGWGNIVYLSGLPDPFRISRRAAPLLKKVLCSVSHETGSRPAGGLFD